MVMGLVQSSNRPIEEEAEANRSPIEEEAEEVCVLFSIHEKTGFQFCSDV
jgi:hypothetical protein